VHATTVRILFPFLDRITLPSSPCGGTSRHESIEANAKKSYFEARRWQLTIVPTTLI